jgi:hypothetical protein
MGISQLAGRFRSDCRRVEEGWSQKVVAAGQIPNMLAPAPPAR